MVGVLSGRFVLSFGVILSCSEVLDGWFVLSGRFVLSFGVMLSCSEVLDGWCSQR